jgi:CRP-like cAMP-binding protein
MSLTKSAKRYEKDSAILTQGQSSKNEVFFLTKGTAVVEVQGNVVGTIRAGEWFGELAAILQTPRTATVRAVTPCDVLVFAGAQDTNLYESMARDPKMIQKLVEQLSSRLVEISKRHAQETAELARQAQRLDSAVAGTLFALEKLVEKYQSKVMDEVRDHLAARSGIPSGRREDAAPSAFPTSRNVIFGG